MKPPERFPPDDPREWINRARSNLIKAANRVPRRLPGRPLLRCPAGGRKGRKGSTDRTRRRLPLCARPRSPAPPLLEEAGETIPETIRQAEKLNPYATASRYPDVADPVSEGEYRDAVRVARAVVDWVQARL